MSLHLPHQLRLGWAGQHWAVAPSVVRGRLWNALAPPSPRSIQKIAKMSLPPTTWLTVHDSSQPLYLAHSPSLNSCSDLLTSFHIHTSQDSVATTKSNEPSFLKHLHTTKRSESYISCLTIGILPLSSALRPVGTPAGPPLRKPTLRSTLRDEVVPLLLLRRRYLIFFCIYPAVNSANRVTVCRWFQQGSVYRRPKAHQDRP